MQVKLAKKPGDPGREEEMNMYREKMTMESRLVKRSAGVIAGILAAGILTAGSVFAAETSDVSDGREVQVTYLNDADADEILLMENASVEMLAAGNGTDPGFYFTDIDDPARVSITGVEDQPWTGHLVTLPDLKVTKDSVLMVADKDYKVSYTNNTDPGQASVKISGTGSYGGRLVGSVTKYFKIIKSSESETEPELHNPIDIPKGTTATLGSGASKAVYTITGNATVTYTKSKAGKKAASAKVPDTVVMIGQNYRVTAVAKKAFFGMKKLKKVTIGKNVTAIGANAFEKCGKLKTLIVKSTSLKAAKCRKCLKGSSVKTVKVPASVKKTYKRKIFVKKVCGLKVTVK